MKTESINIIYAFRKNSHEEVRAFIEDFHGLEMAHIRVFETGTTLDYPTKKGIAVQVTQLDELKQAIDALVAAQEENSR